jgi:hypothetical protein
MSVLEFTQHYNFLHFKLQQQYTNWRCIKSLLQHIVYKYINTRRRQRKKLLIGHAVIKRIKWVLDEKNQHSTTLNCYNEDTTTNAIPLAQTEPSFGEGMSRLLSGLNAATTRNVISATMAHLIPCNIGSRFVFSYDFSDLLVGQMEATLEGEITNVRIGSNKLNNETLTWPESLADDYLHRPSEDEFKNNCFYDLTRRYKKNQELQYKSIQF